MGKGANVQGPSETEKAYMAGFIDGEGCLSIVRAQPRGRTRSIGHRPMVIVANTNVASFDIFVKYYGSKRSPSKKKPNHKIRWVWTCPAGKIYHLLKDVYPYLILKKKQAEIILDFLESTNNHRGHRWGTLLPEGELAKREVFCQQIQELNRKGDDYQQEVATIEHDAEQEVCQVILF